MTQPAAPVGAGTLQADGRHEPSAALIVAGWGASPHWGIYATLLLTSTALLTLEVSLTRLFSFTIWYHFAYLTISVALLGFGASGAVVAAFPRLFERHGQRLLIGALTASAALTIAALLFFAGFPLEVGNVTIKPLRFSLSLLSYYVAVGAPFLLAGFAISVPFTAYPRLMGRLYFFDLFGAALGCVLVVALVEPVGVPGVVVLAAGLLLAAAAALSAGAGTTTPAAGLTGAALASVLCAALFGNHLDVRVTGSKALAGFREDIKRPDAYMAWTALNRVDAFGWDPPTQYLYWRGTGIMRSYDGPFPNGGWLQYDGGNGSNLYSFTGSFDDYAMLDHHLLRTPYVIRDRPNVLVIGVGGGIDMINAIKQGARHVTGVELQPKTVDLLTRRLRPFTGGFYDRSDVTLLAGEGRHFIRKTDQVFDLIQITAVDTFAAQATGAYILAESYLYTVEAQEDFFAHLSGDGLLSMVVGDILDPSRPPPLSTRLALNGYRALQRLGAPDPQEHLMIVSAVSNAGNAQSQDVLVKKTPFSADDVRRVSEFAAAKGFKVAYAPGMPADASTFATVLGSDEPARQRWLDAAWFRMDAVYDRDPFFYNVGKWRNFSPRKSLFFLFPGSFIGQLVLVLMIVQSVGLGALLIVLPLWRGAREGLRAPGVLSYLVYFLALGVGFMFIEISFVQSFVLFLGSPTYALSITIFSLLLFSSAGSLASTRFAERPEAALRWLAAVIALLVVVYVLTLARVFTAFLHLELLPRVLIAVAAQLPMGLTLGMFMPLGIACVARAHPRLVPWAWGINGIGSVIGTTLAVILAMSWGFSVVALSAAGLYIIGTTLMLYGQRSAAAGG